MEQLFVIRQGAWEGDAAAAGVRGGFHFKTLLHKTSWQSLSSGEALLSAFEVCCCLGTCCLGRNVMDANYSSSCHQPKSVSLPRLERTAHGWACIWLQKAAAVSVKQVTREGSAPLRREQYQLRSWWCGVRQKGLANIRGDLLQSRFPAHGGGRRYLGWGNSRAQSQWTT